ncbi:YmfQ family protein [Acidocella sp.]|uniref:YmfQ family protein n=1 Tax=Acidocella sp. TaxID=50710 RepID=UPI0026248CF4|nr:putative phage tail protein [Acidocella sp.]
MMALALTAQNFRTATQALMPRGAVWPRDEDAVQTAALDALAPTYERSTAAANALLVDAFPSTAVNLLPEWESTLGLPDPVIGEGDLISQRQAQVVARLTARGGNMSMGFYIRYAATLGYAITITRFAPFRVGRDAVGQPLYDVAWASAWQINAPQVTLSYFAVGDAVGEPLASWGTNILQFELQRVAPAHTTLIFSYS